MKGESLHYELGEVGDKVREQWGEAKIKELGELYVKRHHVRFSDWDIIDALLQVQETYSRVQKTHQVVKVNLQSIEEIFTIRSLLAACLGLDDGLESELISLQWLRSKIVELRETGKIDLEILYQKIRSNKGELK